MIKKGILKPNMHVHLGDDDGVYEMTLKAFDYNNEGYGDDYSFAICQLVKIS